MPERCFELLVQREPEARCEAAPEAPVRLEEGGEGGMATGQGVSLQ